MEVSSSSTQNSRKGDVSEETRREGCAQVCTDQPGPARVLSGQRAQPRPFPDEPNALPQALWAQSLPYLLLSLSILITGGTVGEKGVPYILGTAGCLQLGAQTVPCCPACLGWLRSSTAKVSPPHC